jgi:hypothetical protein
MWRQQRALTIQSLNRRLDDALARRNDERERIGESFAATCREIWSRFPGADNPDAHHLVVTRCRQYALLWAANELSFEQTYRDITRLLRGQAAPVPEYQP